MKKLFCLLITMFMLCISSMALAASQVGPQIPTSQKIAETYAKTWGTAQSDMTRVGLLYVNKALTTYDDEIDYRMLSDIVLCVNPKDHKLVDCSSRFADMQQMGINDLSLAERSDLIGVMSKDNLDYAVLIQVNPFIRKERMAMFRYTIEMTSDIIVKVIDMNNNKYLYNGKLSEMAKHGTAVAGVSNKSAVMKVLDIVCPKIQDIINNVPKG